MTKKENKHVPLLKRDDYLREDISSKITQESFKINSIKVFSNSEINFERKTNCNLLKDDYILLADLISTSQSKKMRDLENINTLKKKKFALGLMLFYIVIYFFVSGTLLIANCQDQKIIDENYDLPFHFMDFWGSFVFALVEVSILNLANMLEFGSLRFFIGFLGLGATLTTALLFSFNPLFWNLPCHWMEFSAQIFLTISDLFFILNQFQFKNKNNILYKYRYIEVSLVIVLLIGSVMKLLVFGEVFPIEQSERAAHFIEFTGEMINAIFAFLFTYLLFKESEQNLNEILDQQDK